VVHSILYVVQKFANFYGLLTDKKKENIFLIYKEIQKGPVAKSKMINCLLSPHIWLNI